MGCRVCNFRPPQMCNLQPPLTMVTIATRFAIGLTTSTPPRRSNLRRYHRHQGRYCRIANTTKTDPARLEARIYLKMLGPTAQICSQDSQDPRLLHRFQPKPWRKKPQDFSAFALTYILRLSSCRVMGDFVISPLPRLLTKELCAAGPLCSTGVAPFQRYYGPSRHRLVFDRFPGASGYAVYLAPSISRRDEDGFSSCLACPCHRAVPTTPPQGCASSDTLATHPVAFVRHEKTRPLGSIFLSGPPMGSLVLRPGDSLTILKMALSVSFIRLVSSTNVTQATGR